MRLNRISHLNGRVPPMNKQVIILSFIMLAVTAMLHNSCQSAHNGEEGRSSHEPLALYLSTYTDSIAYDKSSIETLEQVKLHLARIHDTLSVLIPERISSIRSYPCSNCHTQPLARLSAGRKEYERKSHWDIELVHGSADVMNCLTCHNEYNLNELVSLTGTVILFDDSYAVCRQCHATQYADWVGGSHGKRLGGWLPPRAMNTCVNCHNPHKPAFESRWPSRLNTASLQKQ